MARHVVEQYGVAMINDIGGGMLDEDMFATVADLQVAYVLMHMRGTPATMQQQTRYGNVTEEVIRFLAERLHRLYELGVHDVLVDPASGLPRPWAELPVAARLASFRLAGGSVVGGRVAQADGLPVVGYRPATCIERHYGCSYDGFGRGGASFCVCMT